MKKPKYTRQTNYHLPKTYVVDKTTIREFEESIARQTGARQWVIETLNNDKSRYSKNTLKYLFRAKSNINTNLRGTKRTLKSILRKNPNKPFDIFEYASPKCSLESISLVRDSPEIIDYLEKVYTDVQSSPFKGLFCWYATDVGKLCIFPLERDHLGQPYLCMFNRVWSYSKVLNRLFIQYPVRHFNLCGEHMVV